jgi:hypothetical protein
MVSLMESNLAFAMQAGSKEFQQGKQSTPIVSQYTFIYLNGYVKVN